MAVFPYENLRAVFNRIPDKDRFVDTVASAAKVAVWLAEQPSEASFVASQIFLQLSAEAAAKIPPNDEGEQTIEIDWSSFGGPFKAFLTLTRQVARNVEEKLPYKPEVNKEQKILEAIYESLRDNTSSRILFEEEMAGTFICEGLVKFLREYSRMNCSTGSTITAEDKEKESTAKSPAILDVASLKQLIVLIARFVGPTSVKLAVSEEAEFIQVWKPNEFSSGVRQPLALSVLGALKSRGGEANAESLLKEAVSISQKDFNDAYTTPYSFLAEHYLRSPGASENLLNKSEEECQMQRMALVPRMMIARAASRFQLCFIRDDQVFRGLHWVCLRLPQLVVSAPGAGAWKNKWHYRRVYPDEMLQKQPLIVALILSFLDYFLLWQSRKIRGPKSAANTRARVAGGSWVADVQRILRHVSGVPCRNIVFHSGEDPVASLKAQPLSDMTTVMALCRDPSSASGSLKEATQWFYGQQGFSSKGYKEDGTVQMVLRSEEMNSMSVLLPGQYKAREVNNILEI